MSTAYTYTRNPYDQIVSWPGYTILPSNGDPFIAQSATLYEKAIQDRNMYVWEGILKDPNINGAIKMQSVDGTSITVYQFIAQAFDSVSGTYKLLIFNNPTTITSANLLTPGSFTVNTWYYVYARLNLAGTSDIVIDPGLPHVYKLYKNSGGMQDKTLKYLGSFRVDSLGKIIPFFKDGERVSYKTNINLITGGTSTVPAAIDLVSVIPPFAFSSTLAFSTFNGNSIDNKLFIYGGTLAIIAATINLRRDTLSRQFIHTTTLELPVIPIPSRKSQYKFQTSGANVSKVDVDILGYRE